MSELSLTTEQSKIVRNLDESISEFEEVDIFGNPKDLKGKFEHVISVSNEMKNLFPEISTMAQKYYYSDDPFAFEGLEAYKEPLFSLFIQLESFSEAKCVSDFTRVNESLFDSLCDLRSYSPEWNSEKGVWM